LREPEPSRFRTRSVYDSDLLKEWLSVWHQSDGALPPLGRSYSPVEQTEREGLLDLALADIQACLCDSGPEYEGIVGAVAHIACAALDIDDDRTEALLRDDFSAVARDLATDARHFDPAVTMDDILQACRNAWTACGLQALLGQPAHLTPAIFAYSMLYPYSDNYLDDKNIPPDAKLCFSSRFRHRLAGDDKPRPENARERIIWEFVSLIESQWPREHYRPVYDCLLAIHQAQERSLQQQHAAGLSNTDILRLSFAKGGASVLADAFLARGSLSEAEKRFAFGWGVLLQLGDDLQDLASDRERGFHTLFSRVAGQAPLDELTTRILNFARRVMESMDTLPSGAGHLKELLRKNSISLLVTAAGEYSELYSDAYLRELESYSPLRFTFLKSRKDRVARWLGPDTRVVEKLLCAQVSIPSGADRTDTRKRPRYGTEWRLHAGD
jgi:hypothetical protein